MTSKEKFIKTIHLKTPIDLETTNRSVILDTNEIASDVGSHHMSACYLKAKVSIATERKPRAGPAYGMYVFIVMINAADEMLCIFDAIWRNL